ncbi:MAG: single-stranded DNA-binding protein [Anaerolineae bacterium]|nr:single-stranded DNA-binding protein [Anaerolineae bacterium]
MYQQVIIIGNVGRDPELSYTPQGVAVAKFTVAVNKVTGKGETRKEKTTWFRVSVWRERAETASQYIRKGSKIMVIGEVDVNAYIDKNGAAQATLELTANDFKFLDSRQSGDEGGGGYQQAPAGGRNSGGSVEDPNDIPF